MKGIAACSIKQIDTSWSIRKLFTYKMMINFRRTKPYVEISLPGEGSKKGNGKIRTTMKNASSPCMLLYLTKLRQKTEPRLRGCFDHRTNVSLKDGDPQHEWKHGGLRALFDLQLNYSHLCIVKSMLSFLVYQMLQWYEIGFNTYVVFPSNDSAVFYTLTQD